MRRPPLAAVALLAVVASAAPASAAQNGIVVQENASIFRDPDERSETLVTVSKGTALRMSSRKKMGWYQVAVPGAQGSRFGWILSSAVERESLIEDLKDAGIATGQVIERDSGRHFIVLRGFYGFHWFLASELRSGGALLRKPEGGGELGHRLWTTWTVLAHVSQLKAVATVGGVSSAYRGTWLALVFEHSLVHSLPWKIDFAIGGGALTRARLTVDTAASSVSSAPTTLFGGLGRVALRWYPFERLALGIEGGTRYVHRKTVPFGGASAEFKLSSAFVNGSLQFEFY